MIVDTIEPTQMLPAYDILCQSLFKDSEDKLANFLTACVIEPSGMTKIHTHPEQEVLYITKGYGLIRINHEQFNVKQGDVINIPLYSRHQLLNLSDIDELHCLSIVADGPVTKKIPENTLIFSPPPTPNGDLHLGHIAGPYLAADILRRFIKLNQKQVTHIVGCDDHQSYIQHVASKKNKSNQMIVDYYQQAIKKSFKLAGISHDKFHQPSRDNKFQEYVIAFFQHLLTKNVISKMNVSLPYCQHCEKTCVEAHVQGLCPNCFSDITGHCCEECGMVADAMSGVTHPHCVTCKNKCGYSQQSVYTFSIQRFKKELSDYLTEVKKSTRIEKFIETILTKDLTDIAITHPGDWGIQVPNLKGQVFNVWFEMAASYCYHYQTADKAIYFFGFDNSFYYTIYNPAIIIASGFQDKLPRAFISNEFYHLDNQKFSTSRHHAVWVKEILAHGQADALRFYLTITRPQYQTKNFNRQDYEYLISKKLLTPWQQWLKLLNTKVTNVENLHLKENERDFILYLRNCVKQAEMYYSVEFFDLESMGQLLLSLLSRALYFSTYHSNYTVELTALKTFSMIALPIMPKSCGDILMQLQNQQPHWESDLLLVKPQKCDIVLKKYFPDFIFATNREKQCVAK